mgnify:CR=1 FL=1
MWRNCWGAWAEGEKKAPAQPAFRRTAAEGGNRPRLMNHPALILADEPTGNLDSKTSREVIALLHGMSRKYRQSVLMITHNMNIAADADRVFRVTDGCLEEVNSGREAFHE